MTSLDSALWREMTEYLRDRHAPICRQWFEDLEPGNLHSGLLKIKTQTAVQQNYLQKKCVEQFQEAAQAVTGNLVVVRFVHDDVDFEPAPDREPVSVHHNGQMHATPQKTAQSNGSVSTGKDSLPPEAFNPSIRPRQTLTILNEPLFPDDPAADEIVLCPDYDFDNFVTGPSNRLAYAASVAVANQPGTAYNPLFIHGGVGLGKTHLLQAVCQSIMQAKPDARICYLSCDGFMNQFLDCVQRGLMNEFRHRYRHVDMLVIDDIHFLAKHESSQEEFFHTFNALYQSNKQIVLSSDSPPSEIPELEERLISRFQWGLVAPVGKPTYETRVAIIKAKAKLRNINFSDDLISYIATKIDSNARELEGAIISIQGHASLQGRTIDLALAQEALGDQAIDTRSSQTTLQHIVEAVTRHYDVKLSDLQSKRRHKSITEPRQVCMWLARKRTRFSLQEIGGHFGGRDHTTVMHSIKTVENRLATEPQFTMQLEKLETDIEKMR